MNDEERRRGVALALELRPEIDLDELQRLLARAGVDVDADTLVSDLDALGYDVDDPHDVVDDPHDVDVDDHDDVDDIDAEGRDEREAVDERDLGRDDPEDDEDAGGGGSRRGALLVLGAAVLVVIAVLVAYTLVDDGDPVVTGDTVILDDERVEAGSDGPTPGGSDTTAETRIAPEGPGSDPALDAGATLTDDFERSGVGDFPGVATWELLSGEWTNTDGNLDLTSVPTDGPAVAAIEVDSAEVRAQVDVDRPASRAGIAFRIQDEGNLFVWAAVPEFESVILFEVIDGLAEPVADSGIADLGDGMPTLGIDLVGDRAELLLEGVVVATYDELPPAEGATRIGVAALPGAETLPLFDEYRVLAP